MGGSKRTLESEWEKEEQKRSELLEVPAAIAESHELIGELRAKLEASNDLVESLKQEVESSNSIRSKAKDYLIGGVVGAVIGILLSSVL